MVKTKAWRFTLNNPTDNQIPTTWKKRGVPLFSYCVWSLERAPTTGTLHLQGYVYWTTRKTLETVKHIDKRANWLVADATAVANTAYCTKDKTHVEGPWILGELPVEGRGKRSDLKRLYSAIQDGANWREVFREHTDCAYKYITGITKHMTYVKPNPPINHRVELHIGTTGTGKTRYCMDSFPKHWAIPLRQGRNMWFDGYDGHKVALIDDYNGEMALTVLLRVLDRYVLAVPVKHGFAWWRPELIIITSNYDVDKWYNYDNRQESLLALKRRIDSTTYHRTLM